MSLIFMLSIQTVMGKLKKKKKQKKMLVGMEIS